jgi:uncharacterized membrane protein YhiD involved in acid resistance
MTLPSYDWTQGGRRLLSVAIAYVLALPLTGIGFIGGGAIFRHGATVRARMTSRW